MSFLEGKAVWRRAVEWRSATRGMQSLLEHFGFTVNTTLFCDSVAARGIAQRAGLGKVKALAVKTLCLQEVVREKGIQIKWSSPKGKQD